MSDTHGNVVIGERIVKNIENMDLLIHAGDFIKDAEKLAERLSIRVEAVVGNCDYPRTSPQELTLDLEGVKVYITHGHRFEHHDFFNSMMERAGEVEADLVVFGHTHLATSFKEGNTVFFNPGSISSPRLRGPTYGIIKINGGKVETEILPYQG